MMGIPDTRPLCGWASLGETVLYAVLSIQSQILSLGMFCVWLTISPLFGSNIRSHVTFSISIALTQYPEQSLLYYSLDSPRTLNGIEMSNPPITPDRVYGSAPFVFVVTFVLIAQDTGPREISAISAVIL